MDVNDDLYPPCDTLLVYGIKNKPPLITYKHCEQYLITLLNDYGPIRSIEMWYENDLYRGFVKFLYQEDAIEAKKELHLKELVCDENKFILRFTLKVRYAEKPTICIKDNSLLKKFYEIPANRQHPKQFKIDNKINTYETGFHKGDPRNINQHQTEPSTSRRLSPSPSPLPALTQTPSTQQPNNLFFDDLQMSLEISSNEFSVS
jgi:hypothetical protein